MIVIKIGGSVITDKKGYEQSNMKNIEKAAKTIAKCWKEGIREIILVHGAGSFGHQHVEKYGINDGVKTESQKLGYADTHRACAKLSGMFVEKLVGNGVPAVSIPPAAIVKSRNRRIQSMETAVVFSYLKQGYLPVLYGDMVPDEELGGSVCSGDQIVAKLGKKADRIILGTNVDGVFDDRANIIPLITRENFPEIEKHLAAVSNDVTGGMGGKIRELLELDTPSYIFNAEDQDKLEALIKGKGVPCTVIRPKG